MRMSAERLIAVVDLAERVADDEALTLAVVVLGLQGRRVMRRGGFSCVADLLENQLEAVMRGMHALSVALVQSTSSLPTRGIQSGAALGDGDKRVDVNLMPHVRAVRLFKTDGSR